MTDCFYGIHDGKVGLEILDKYDSMRREIYKTVTDRISTTNLERVQKDPNSLTSGSDPFFEMLERAGEDSTVHEQLLKVGHSRVSVPVTDFELRDIDRLKYWC